MNKCDFNKIKIGDIFSRHSYGKVKDKDIRNNLVLVENSEGFEWSVASAIIEKEFSFADQSEEVRKVTRTELIEHFKNYSRTALTVNFNKKVKPVDVKKELHELYPNKGKILSESQYKKEINKVVTKALAGEERTMVGYHTGNQDDTGRIFFTDMNSEDGRPRQVDPRTINWLIVDNIRYEVKR